jgi:hypothetical protein
VTATTASGISPDGYNNAYLIKPSSTGTDRFVYDDTGSGGYTANADYTNTIFVKASGINWCYARFEDKTNASSFVYFNLATGSVGSTLGSVSVTKSIENYGNGWYRIRVTGNMSSGVGGNNNVLFGICDADGSTYVTASGNNGVLFYGPQSEQGSYHTSAIPTLGTAVTRVAETAAKTGISSLIGQTEGTLFVEALLTHSTASNEYLIQVSVDASNRFFIYREASTNKLGAFARVASSNIFTPLTAAATTGTIKAAFAYKSGSFAFYVNGVQVAVSSATYTTPASMGIFDLDSNAGTENGFYTYAQALLFKTRLTNEQLAELTTL